MAIEVDGLEVYSEEFNDAVRRYLAISEKSMEEVMRDEARLFLNDAIRKTPPFTWARVSATKAKAYGVQSVRRDLNRHLWGKKLVGQRRVTHLFGDSEVEGLPFVVPAKEKHADARAEWNRRKRLRGGYGRARSVVDEPKFKRLWAEMSKKVGYLGSGFGPAAVALGAKMPAFMRRHGGPGGVRITVREDLVRIRIENRVRYAGKVRGFKRGIQAALGSRRMKIDAKIKRELRNLEKKGL